MTALGTQTLTDEVLNDFVAEWYRALDRHDNLVLVLPYLLDDGLECRFPETTKYGHAGFTEWYETVTRRFFDEVHTVTSVDIERTGDPAAAVTVKVVVNWQAKIWDPPAPKSAWLGFNAYQTWEVVPGPNGPQVKTYSVDRFEPMPGSATL
jgi:hypothetical protein